MYAGFNGANASMAKAPRVFSRISLVPASLETPTQTAKNATMTKTYVFTFRSSSSVPEVGRVFVRFGRVMKSWMVPIGQIHPQGALPIMMRMMSIAPNVKNGKIPVENSRIIVSKDPAMTPKGASSGAKMGSVGKLFQIDNHSACTLGMRNQASNMYPLIPMKAII
jgi:hypothetical protein